MELSHNGLSPYVRKVMLVLHETGQLDQVSLSTAVGTPLDQSAMPVARNPLGKVPVLERPDGPALYDSRVICRYLNDRADGGLYPSPPKLWETLVLEATADGILDAAVGIVYEARLRPKEGRSEAVSEALWLKIARAVSAIEARWMPYLRGPMDMGHLAVGAALEYCDFRLPDRDWRTGAPELVRWLEVFAARPSMVATAPPDQ